jgi:hypothetical protein
MYIHKRSYDFFVAYHLNISSKLTPFFIDHALEEYHNMSWLDKFFITFSWMVSQYATCIPYHMQSVEVDVKFISW